MKMANLCVFARSDYDYVTSSSSSYAYSSPAR